MLRSGSLHRQLDVGDEFTPAARPQYSAHSRLLVRLRNSPTLRHYDPEHVLVPILSAADGPELLSVYTRGRKLPVTGSDAA
jgi:hypothetical protein